MYALTLPCNPRRWSGPFFKLVLTCMRTSEKRRNHATDFVDVETDFPRMPGILTRLIAFDRAERKARAAAITPSTFVVSLKNSIARRSAMEKSFVARARQNVKRADRENIVRVKRIY